MKSSSLPIYLFGIGIIIGKNINTIPISVAIVPIIIVILFLFSLVLEYINKKKGKSFIYWFNHCIIHTIILFIGYGLSVLFWQ
jgi:hypothetical protein